VADVISLKLRSWHHNISAVSPCSGCRSAANWWQSATSHEIFHDLHGLLARSMCVDIQI